MRYVAMQRFDGPFRVWFVCLLAGLVLLQTGCSDVSDTDVIDLSDVATPEEIDSAYRADAAPAAEFLFGFDLRHGPSEDARQYLPLLEYLARTTGYRFRLHFTKDATELAEQLSSGDLQFAAIGAGTYLTANSNTAIVPLARGVNAEGERGYRSIVVVAAESALADLPDLKGKRIAFGSPTSTQGHWIPRIMFDAAGIALEDFETHFFTGSHLDCAEAVISGEADACGMQDTLANRLIASGSVRALAISPVFPSSGVFAGAAVPVEAREAVRKALIAFEPQGRDRQDLYHWERTEMAGGFTSASKEDYAQLLTQAVRLGLLPRAHQPVDVQ